MRHKRKGRRLGRSSSHRKAMLRNLAASLILTERPDEYYEGLVDADGRSVNPPAFKGRVVTTVPKAKEVRPLVEKCITIAKKAIPHQRAAEAFESDAERNTEAWKQWREGEGWKKWNAAIAPAVDARRRVFAILRNKEAVEILFEDIAPRFEDRPGGYTRVLRLAKPRLGDAGPQAILEFVGVHDRVKVASQAPAFTTSEDDPDSPTSDAPASQDAPDGDASEADPETTSATEPAATSDDGE